MKVFDAKISHQVSDYLNNNLKNIFSFEKANQKIYDAFGIIDFFDKDMDLETVKDTISRSESLVSEPDRAEYGDFQTNEELANQVALHLVSKHISPEIILEPTCGKGNFIVASLRNFEMIKHIVGVEIYKPYVWETKFNIIDFYLNTPQLLSKPDISIYHCDVFAFDFKTIAKKFSTNEILIIGNPPWVTNAKLGSLNSANLPKKTNFKNHSGLDAMTGKGNFDIAEFITLTMLKTFQNFEGNLLFLVKNAVIKNIVSEQLRNKLPIANLEKHCIDSKKEFNVSVEAALFYCKLNVEPTFSCKEFDFYMNKNHKSEFGWLGNKFVSNIDKYAQNKYIDSESPFVWRQGLKHDCSTIMELDKVEDTTLNVFYVNGLNEKNTLEDNLVYGLLKSSDLKHKVINKTRKYTIVTQKKVGQETKFIRDEYPKTYQYLINHQTSFEDRKSSIYMNKPAFSIFGIGDYSFKPYKVAISGLYKTFHFTLVLPQNDKPLMLDDTCYFIGFDKIEFAVYTFILLNSEMTMQFLHSITFADAKRTFTKDVLMRIDLWALSNLLHKNYLETELNKFNDAYNFNFTLCMWDKFIEEMKPIKSFQTELFL